VFLPADGGKPRVVTGERDWRKAVASMPLGWTRDGLARVQLLQRWGARPKGVYLFDPAKPAPKAAKLATGC
jgi:hypothetical protein